MVVTGMAKVKQGIATAVCHNPRVQARRAGRYRSMGKPRSIQAEVPPSTLLTSA
jgi:hypothetical protein